MIDRYDDLNELTYELDHSPKEELEFQGVAIVLIYIVVMFALHVVGVVRVKLTVVKVFAIITTVVLLFMLIGSVAVLSTKNISYDETAWLFGLSGMFLIAANVVGLIASVKYRSMLKTGELHKDGSRNKDHDPLDF